MRGAPRAVSWDAAAAAAAAVAAKVEGAAACWAVMKVDALVALAAAAQEVEAMAAGLQGAVAPWAAAVVGGKVAKAGWVVPMAAAAAVDVEFRLPPSHRSRRSGTRNVCSAPCALCTSSSKTCNAEAYSSTGPSSRNWATRGMPRSGGRRTPGRCRENSVARRRGSNLYCTRPTILILATTAVAVATSVAADTAQRAAGAAKDRSVVALVALVEWLATEVALRGATGASMLCLVRQTRKRLAESIATKRPECLA